MHNKETTSVSHQLQQYHWFTIAYLSYVHLAAAAGIFYVSSCKWQTLAWAFALYVWSGIGITGGVHRLWAHRSYKAHWIVRTWYMLMCSIANQGSIYRWARDHRTHHKFSETDADPHNVRCILLEAISNFTLYRLIYALNI